VFVAARLVAELDDDASSTLVLAVTSLGDDVFVLRDESSLLDVYDSSTLRRMRRVLVTGLTDPSHMTSSLRHNCVYISDFKGKV